MKIGGKIYGQRIVIRNCEQSDLPFLTSMWLDRENGRYTSDPVREAVDEVFQRALDTLADSELGYYLVIELDDTGIPVGSFLIFPKEEKDVYEIGYCIHKNYWRHGYAAEAVCAVLEWLKGRGAVKAMAEAAVENVPSNALLQKLGFEAIQKSRFQKYNMDVWFDSRIYEKAL